MRQWRCWLAVCIAGVIGVSAARAQEPPKPGPEHAKLKEMVGEWEATMDFMGQKSKGTMTWKMGTGDLYLTSDFKGEMFGMKFEGHGVDTYDTTKKKYVAVWYDNMMPSIMMMEGSYDKDGKKLTMTGDGPSGDGKLVKFKSVSEIKDKDTIVFTMTNAGPDGKDQSFTITYKRKK